MYEVASQTIDFELQTSTIAYFYLEELVAGLQAVCSFAKAVNLETCCSILDLLYENPQYRGCEEDSDYAAAAVLVNYFAQSDSTLKHLIGSTEEFLVWLSPLVALQRCHENAVPEDIADACVPLKRITSYCGLKFLVSWCLQAAAYYICLPDPLTSHFALFRWREFSN